MILVRLTHIHHLVIMVSSVSLAGEGRAAILGGFSESHRNPTTPVHDGGFPQEPHRRYGTLRYTCYVC